MRTRARRTTQHTTTATTRLIYFFHYVKVRRRQDWTTRTMKCADSSPGASTERTRLDASAREQYTVVEVTTVLTPALDNFYDTCARRSDRFLSDTDHDVYLWRCSFILLRLAARQDDDDDDDDGDDDDDDRRFYRTRTPCRRCPYRRQGRSSFARVAFSDTSCA